MRGAPARLFAALLALLCLSVPAVAQSAAPFDMTPEGAAPGAPGLDAMPGRPPPPTAPSAPPFSLGIAPDAEPPAPSRPTVTTDASPPSGFDRPIVPYDKLRLEGEIDERSWSVYLTAEQAADQAVLNIGYANAVVVAPETSQLRVFINDRLVVERPIAAPEGIGRISAPVPAGLLQPGANVLRFQAAARHRTDCSVASTYELWTEIKGGLTSLSFASPDSGRLRRINDMRAIGVDEHGATNIRIIAPGASDSSLAGPLLRLVQATALYLGTPNQTVTIADDASAAAGPGTLTIAFGTADDLRKMIQGVPPEADRGPLASFIDDQRLGASILVVSGPSGQAVATAADEVARPVDRPRGSARTTLNTQSWLYPDVPLLLGESYRRLSDLGFWTQEFSGRWFKTSFAVGVPSDFYAEAYGQATLLLDAAYSAEVRPGSHIDVYVNGNIAATTPITTAGGGIFRHFPIRIPLRHMRPGPNIVGVEAQLLTASDDQCLPGAQSPTASRFVMFDTSEFALDDFARIAQVPNLGALMGTGFPYNNSEAPTALLVNQGDPEVLSAAATLIGRMAMVAGRVIDVEPASTVAAIAGRNALLVGTVAQMAPAVLQQLGIAESVRTNWRDPVQTPPVTRADAPKVAGEAAADPPPGAAGPAEVDNGATLERWRQNLAGSGGWRGQVSAFQDWLQRTFEISFTTLRLRPSADEAYEPPRGATLLLAQESGPAEAGTWTLVTAPSAQSLGEGVRALVDQPQWSRLAGHIVTYNARTGDLQSVPVATYTFIATQPVSLQNFRLIAANWLSENILSYSVLLVVSCMVLGLGTAGFLASIGRRG